VIIANNTKRFSAGFPNDWELFDIYSDTFQLINPIMLELDDYTTRVNVIGQNNNIVTCPANIPDVLSYSDSPLSEVSQKTNLFDWWYLDPLRKIIKIEENVIQTLVSKTSVSCTTTLTLISKIINNPNYLHIHAYINKDIVPQIMSILPLSVILIEGRDEFGVQVSDKLLFNNEQSLSTVNKYSFIGSIKIIPSLNCFSVEVTT